MPLQMQGKGGVFMYTRQFITQIAILLPLCFSLLYYVLFVILPDMADTYKSIKRDEEYERLLAEYNARHDNFNNADKEHIDAAILELEAIKIRLDKLFKDRKAG